MDSVYPLLTIIVRDLNFWSDDFV